MSLVAISSHYIESYGLTTLTCRNIELFQFQFQHVRVDEEAFKVFAKNYNVQAPFSLFTDGDSVSRTDLKYLFLLFSKDPLQMKLELLRKLIGASPRELMRVLELKFEFMCCRVPQEVLKQGHPDSAQVSCLVAAARVSCAHEIARVSSEEESVDLVFPRLLTISYS